MRLPVVAVYIPPVILLPPLVVSVTLLFNTVTEAVTPDVKIPISWVELVAPPKPLSIVLYDALPAF